MLSTISTLVLSSFLAAAALSGAPKTAPATGGCCGTAAVCDKGCCGETCTCPDCGACCGAGCCK